MQTINNTRIRSQRLSLLLFTFVTLLSCDNSEDPTPTKQLEGPALEFITAKEGLIALPGSMERSQNSYAKLTTGFIIDIRNQLDKIYLAERFLPEEAIYSNRPLNDALAPVDVFIWKEGVTEYALQFQDLGNNYIFEIFTRDRRAPNSEYIRMARSEEKADKTAITITFYDEYFQDDIVAEFKWDNLSLKALVVTPLDDSGFPMVHLKLNYNPLDRTGDLEVFNLSEWYTVYKSGWFEAGNGFGSIYDNQGDLLDIGVWF